MQGAPVWLKRSRVEKNTDRIQRKLEWSTRRVKVLWYKSQKKFSYSHNLGSHAIAVTKISSKGESIHLGPRVNTKNFNSIFMHELVHVIINQKYKRAIPKWLEEGLANHLSKRNKVDYKWLSKFKIPDDITDLAHPMLGSEDMIRFKYKASQALAEMLDKKCKLVELLSLSVGRKMENYIKTYCEIPDITLAFKKWVILKAK